MKKRGRKSQRQSAIGLFLPLKISAYVSQAQQDHSRLTEPQIILFSITDVGQTESSNTKHIIIEF